MWAKLQMVDAKCHHVEIEARMVMLVAQNWSLVTIRFLLMTFFCLETRYPICKSYSWTMNVILLGEDTLGITIMGGSAYILNGYSSLYKHVMKLYKNHKVFFMMIFGFYLGVLAG